MDKIYCIGDSHVSFFSGQDSIQPLWPKFSDDKIPIFKTIRLGAVLAYSLSKNNSSLKGKELLSILLDRNVPETEKEIPLKSKLLFCFGEIDCRAHILKQSKKRNISIQSVIEKVAEDYFKVIEYYSNLEYEIIVWGIIPSSLYDLKNNKLFPTYGSCEERNIITSLFNDYLRKSCEKKTKITFISIYDNLVDKNGLTNMDFYMDNIHLSQKAMPIALSKILDAFPSLQKGISRNKTPT